MQVPADEKNIEDEYFLGVIRQFKQRPPIVGPQSDEKYAQWNGTSIGLSRAILRHYQAHQMQHEPKYQEIQSQLEYFLAWWDRQPEHAKPAYLTFPPQTSLEMLEELRDELANLRGHRRPRRNKIERLFIRAWTTKKMKIIILLIIIVMGYIWFVL